MPTLTQARTAVDNFVSNRWATIVARQENYRANRGRYWQGLRTHSTTPAWSSAADGSSAGDLLGSHPTDQFEDWLSVFPEWLAEALPCSVQVSAYDGPQGQGWVLELEVIYNGTTYRRVVNVGPEARRAHGWQAVVEPA